MLCSATAICLRASNSELQRDFEQGATSISSVCILDGYFLINLLFWTMKQDGCCCSSAKSYLYPIPQDFVRDADAILPVVALVPIVHEDHIRLPRGEYHQSRSSIIRQVGESSFIFHRRESFLEQAKRFHATISSRKPRLELEFVFTETKVISLKTDDDYDSVDYRSDFHLHWQDIGLVRVLHSRDETNRNYSVTIHFLSPCVDSCSWFWDEDWSRSFLNRRLCDTPCHVPECTHLVDTSFVDASLTLNFVVVLTREGLHVFTLGDKLVCFVENETFLHCFHPQCAKAFQSSKDFLWRARFDDGGAWDRSCLHRG